MDTNLAIPTDQRRTLKYHAAF